MPRKMGPPSMSDMKKCAATLRQLVTHCVARGYLVKEGTKELLDMIKVSGNFNAQGISSALQKLSDEGYWDVLANEEGGEEDNVDEEGEDDDHDVPIMCGEDMPLSVKEVRVDGWVFEDMFSGGGYNSDNPDEDPPDATLLRLPPHVASMGLVGMSISCMNLVMRHGVLRPVGTHDLGTEFVCANVYPP